MAEQAASWLQEAARLMQLGQAEPAEEVMKKLSMLDSSVLLQVTTDFLQKTTCPHIVYFSTDVLKKIAIRDWSTFTAQVQFELLSFTTLFVKERHEVLRTCRLLEQVYHMYAVLCKLAWPLGDDQALPEFVKTIVTPVVDQLRSDVAIGAGLARHLIEEFDSTVAGSLGKAWDVHEKLRGSFAQNALLPLSSCLFEEPSVLQSLGSLPARSAEPVLRLLSEGVLRWQFEGRQPDDETPPETLRPGSAWHDVLLQPANIAALLALHSNVGTDMQHHIQEAICHFCSLTGNIFIEEREQIGWMEYMLDAVFVLAERAIDGYVESKGDLLLGCCRAFYKITMGTCSRHWYKMPTFAEKTQHLMRFTCALVTEYSNRPDDTCIVESSEFLLVVWVTYVVDMLDEMQFYSSGYIGTDPQKELLRESCKHIFEAFLNGQMKAPATEVVDEHHDTEYSGSSQSLAALLGRQVPGVALPQLIQHLQKLTDQIQTGSVPDNFHDSLMVAVNVITELVTDPAESEVPGIPLVIVDSIRAYEDVQFPEATCGVLVAAKMLGLLCEGMLSMVQSHPHCVSPLTLATLLKALARWASTYICPDPDANCDVPEVIINAFDSGRASVDMFVGLAHEALCSFPSDSDITRAALSLLLAVAAKSDVQEWLTSTPKWGALAQSEAAHGSRLSALSLEDRCKLMEILCLGSGKDSFVQLLPSIEQEVQSCLNNSQGAGHDNQHARTLVIALTRVRGVGCSSVHAHSRQTAVFEWVKDLFPLMVQVAQFYRGRTSVMTVLVELMDDLVRAQNAFLDERQMHTVLECCTRLTQIYCESNSGREYKGRLQQASDNEDMEATLVSIMLLLRHVVEWDMLEHSGEEGRRADTGDLVFLGVHHVIALINPVFLGNITLANTCFGLLDDCFTLYCDKLQMVPPQLCEQLAMALQFAVSSPQPNILRAGYGY